MSNLRKQLDAARNAYRDTHYQGDLASEILGAQAQRPGGASVTRWSMRLGLFAAAAAAIVLFMRPQTPDNPSVPIEVAIVTSQAMETSQDTTLTEVAWSDLPSLSMSAPSDLDTRGTDEMNIAPAMPDFSVSVPSFSLLEDQGQTQQQLQSNSANIQETVL